MRCENCGEELPGRARFCPACGAPVEQTSEEALTDTVAMGAAEPEPEDLPASKKLEEPLEPVGVGAVPLVPIAPPPRATRVRPRSPRPYAPHGHPGSASVPPSQRTWSAVERDWEERERAAERRAESGEEESTDGAAKASAAAASGGRADAVRRGARRAASAVRRGLSQVGALKSRRIAVVAVAAAAVIVVVFLGVVSTSWLGPFAPAGEPAPQVQPPSDGSIDPIQSGDDAEEPQDEGGAQLPEGAPEVRDAVEDYSWEELSQVSALIADAPSDDEGLEIAKTYHLCDESGELDGTQTKSLELSDGTEVSMRVAGFRQDQKADGSGPAGITFLAEDGVSEQAMNATGQLVGGWEDSTLRSWMNQSLIGELPSEVSDLLVSVEKTTNPPAGTGETGQDVTEDKLWVPSYSEVVGEPGASSNRYGLYESEGPQYQLFSDLGVTWAEPSPELVIPSGGYWWLRSPDVANGRWFVVVGPEGQSAYGHRPATENAIVMGFCL